jgi:23S rRNA pseudouridine2605 synthase
MRRIPLRHLGGVVERTLYGPAAGAASVARPPGRPVARPHSFPEPAARPPLRPLLLCPAAVHRPPTTRTTVSLPRALSKLGYCSRTDAERLVAAGRVRVDGAVVRDPDRRVHPEFAVIEVDGTRVGKVAPVYLALNKPRGVVTTRSDPRARATVYDCLAGADLPFVGPVGRLDKASEGLLLLTNDTRWADRLLDPASHVEKT